MSEMAFKFNEHKELDNVEVFNTRKRVARKEDFFEKNQTQTSQNESKSLSQSYNGKMFKAKGEYS